MHHEHRDANLVGVRARAYMNKVLEIRVECEEKQKSTLSYTLLSPADRALLSR